jgi:hypothetical protein
MLSERPPLHASKEWQECEEYRSRRSAEMGQRDDDRADAAVARLREGKPVEQRAIARAEPRELVVHPIHHGDEP